jgi:hypothetical protein
MAAKYTLTVWGHLYECRRMNNSFDARRSPDFARCGTKSGDDHECDWE